MKSRRREKCFTRRTNQHWYEIDMKLIWGDDEGMLFICITTMSILSCCAIKTFDNQIPMGGITFLLKVHMFIFYKVVVVAVYCVFKKNSYVHTYSSRVFILLFEFRSRGHRLVVGPKGHAINQLTHNFSTDMGFIFSRFFIFLFIWHSRYALVQINRKIKNLEKINPISVSKSCVNEYILH